MTKLRKRKVEEPAKKKKVFHDELLMENDVKIFQDEVPPDFSVGKRYVLVQQREIDNQIVRLPVVSIFILSLKEALNEGGEALLLKKHSTPRSPVRPYAHTFEELVYHMKNLGCRLMDLRHGVVVLDNVSPENSSRRYVWCKNNELESEFIKPLQTFGKFLLYDAETLTMRKPRPYEKRMGKKKLKKKVS